MSRPALFYFETAAPDGHWAPATSAEPPPVSRKTHRPDRLGTDAGPRIRAVTQVHPDHHGLTLDQLAEVYGPDGRFRATRPKPEEFPA